MVLPIWKSMTTNLYDLLLGHEVGHALYTPPQGWHDAVTDEKRKGFKSYLNVIEDTRIEKMIQEKFPGLKTSFRKGYSDLMEMDFFGVSSRGLDIETLPLIDRINLHYKIGSYLNLKFSDTEQVYIEKIDKIKSWDDVVAIAEELYENGKEEMKLRELDDLEDNWEIGEGDPTGEHEEDDDADVDGDATGSKEQDPKSLTDEYFRKKENELVNDDVKPYVYAYRPTANLEQVIVPYKRIKKHYNNFKTSDYVFDTGLIDSEVSKAKEALYKKFTSENKSYISYLIKEFEMKRNAKQYARASIAKTGSLDIKKVFSYKIKDDIFKRVSVVPKGKNHGLLMFIDYSGSMTDNILPTIEQTILLATFCRKVNIPFRVYAFTDLRNEHAEFMEEHGVRSKVGSSRYVDYTELNKMKKFSSNDNELVLEDVHFRLREYLSSEMSSSEFKEAIKYWLLVGVCLSRRSWRSKDQDYYRDIVPFHIQNSGFEGLNGTPLNEAIVASIDIVKVFKEKYKLDVVNTVFLTDGDSNDTYDKYQNGIKTRFGYRSDLYNLIIRDKKTMEEGRKTPKAQVTIGLLQLLKNMTGVNTIGFFITPYFSRRIVQNRIEAYDAELNNFDERYRKSRDNKFFMINNAGYDDYYIIPGGEDLQIKDDDLDKIVVESKSDLKRAFMKMQKGKSVNRVLLTRFIDKIS